MSNKLLHSSANFFRLALNWSPFFTFVTFFRLLSVKKFLNVLFDDSWGCCVKITPDPVVHYIRSCICYVYVTTVNNVKVEVVCQHLL